MGRKAFEEDALCQGKKEVSEERLVSERSGGCLGWLGKFKRTSGVAVEMVRKKSNTRACRRDVECS